MPVVIRKPYTSNGCIMEDAFIAEQRRDTSCRATGAYKILDYWRFDYVDIAIHLDKLVLVTVAAGTAGALLVDSLLRSP